MTALERAIRLIDGLNDAVGRAVAWLTLVTVLVCFTVVALRYVANTGFIWMQDMYVWSHAIVFMVGAGYTLLNGGHVRVDVFYRPMSLRRKAWVDLLGCLIFLFPWLIVVWAVSWQFVAAAWAVYERSLQPAGLPGVFLLKTVLLVFCILVGLQGLALLFRSILVLRGKPEYLAATAAH